ncbi:mediator of RNA polymerase II transcription subunit 21-like isoform X2 [Nilaparvata lugens]|uniref:mediator of RNA polymerase II transcription subunit 21-like isoform X2 n=1 Tax=Nilaparvata lugens TaxID=108931 RepID=UPI000B9865C0|nr:mediator of RNA polymerase II transcription subunit 21-like isoform X2 [Nilaparvata lugens]
MSDRITQLQDLVSRLSCTFSESLGVIGQFSEPQKFPEMEELKRLRAEKRRLRAEQKKRKQVVSDLPMNQKKVLENSQHVNYSADFAKARSLEVLQEENEEAAEKLDELLNTGEKLLKKIREARSFLSNGYLEAMSAK